MSSPSSRPVRTAKVFIVGCLSTLALLQVIDWLHLGKHEQIAQIVLLALAAVVVPISSIAAWFLVLTSKGLIRDDQVEAQESVNRAPSSVIEQNWRSSTPSQQDSQQPVAASAPGDMPQPAHLSSSLGAVAPNSHDDVTRPLIDSANIARWRLVIETGPEAGSQFPLKEAMLAGRAPYADLLLQSNRISREHARFSIENGAPMVSDLASRNGTHVNGRRITAPQRLEAGDEVRLHDVIIRVVQRDVATNA